MCVCVCARACLRLDRSVVSRPILNLCTCLYWEPHLRAWQDDAGRVSGVWSVGHGEIIFTGWWYTGIPTPLKIPKNLNQSFGIMKLLYVDSQYGGFHKWGYPQ